MGKAAKAVLKLVAGKRVSLPAVSTKGDDMPRGRPRADARTVDTEWFKTVLGKAKLSQRGLAAILTRDVAILNRTLLGTREATAGEVARIAEALHTTTDEVLRRLGYDVEPRGVTITGALRADGRITSITTKAGTFESIAPVAGECRALVAETKGGPLEPYDGAIIIYQESTARTVPPDAIGRLCIVESAEDVVPLLGTLTRADRRGAVRFTPFGGAGDPRDLPNIIRASIVLRIIFPQ